MKWLRSKGAIGFGAALIAIVAFAGGAAAGFLARPASAVSQSSVDLAPFWKAWELLDDNFIPANAASTTLATTTTDQAKVWGAIAGLAEAYKDPYTVFFPPEENKLFEDEIRGDFGGVGIEIDLRNDYIVVVSPLPDTPAKRAGIKSGDTILEIDGHSTFKMDTNEALKRIRGEVGTSVKLKLISEGSQTPRTVSLTRALIKVPTIETRQLPNHVFLIQLFNFSATAPKEFRTALQAFSEAKTDKLILDLRGNPGGYLDAAIDIASWFLPKGAVVVTEDRNKSGNSTVYQSKGYNVFTNKLKMVILVDEGSASASEILAGALHEHGIAKLVGEKTFGKGSVQEVFPITKDTSLKVTVARWLTPKGLSISHNGLEPDLKVAQATSSPAVAGTAATSTAVSKNNDANDTQLQAALKLFQSWK